ncbi:MAG: guanylate kinase [Ruminococcaceae bacterium]|nr:guanylate kinase [Oscillospiraceae bacterium]
MEQVRRGKTFIISGPSGVGKGTVLKELFKTRDMYYSVSATTRAPRDGEVDGVHYHFMDAEEFRTMIAEDALLEHAEYAGNYYGTPKRYVDEAMDSGRDVILEIELQGARQVHAKRPETVRIFIGPPSWEELERRLVSRGTDTPEKIAQRLQRARIELESADEYDYLIINDTVEKAAAELDAILCAEHCRVDDRLDQILGK